LEHLGGLDGRLMDASVTQEHHFERSPGPVCDNDDEPFAVTVQQLGFDDAGDGIVVDEPRPGG